MPVQCPIVRCTSHARSRANTYTDAHAHVRTHTQAHWHRTHVLTRMRTRARAHSHVLVCAHGRTQVRCCCAHTCLQCVCLRCGRACDFCQRSHKQHTSSTNTACTFAEDAHHARKHACSRSRNWVSAECVGAWYAQVVETLVQVAKVRTEKLRYEAAKNNKYQVKLTLQPMLLLNQAENDAQTGQQAGGALAASNQASPALAPQPPAPTPRI